jgi:hypothetical protein
MPDLTPISLIIDDSCPLVHVYRCHHVDVHGKTPHTKDGRELERFIPNAFLERFCDVADRWGMAGKFSIVPAPGGLGDVVRGIEGFDPSLTREWLDTAKRRLSARWDFCSEGITHNLALDLETGDYFPEGENAWSQHQDRTTLTPYLVHQLRLLKEAGIDATGVTSPWVFGIQVEPEYVAAIVAAQKEVYGRDFSWYFLHMPHDRPDSRPHVAYREGETVLVHVPGVVDDVWWATIDSPRTDAEWIDELADRLLTRDGTAGRIREVLDAGGWPILLTHWQSLFSNGLETGLAVLDETGRRVAARLHDEVRWMSFSEIARLTVAD